MAQHRTRLHAHHVLSMFLLLVLLISAGLTALVPRPLAVQAQISNNEPTQSYASIVDCIRAGTNLPIGQSFASPLFVTTCFGTKIVSGAYGANTGNNDADPTDASVVMFGDGQPDAALTEPGHTGLANLGQVGAVYGLAYSSGTNPNAPAGAPRQRRLFAGAYTKMQTRYGPAGPGGIYIINQSTGTVSTYVQVPNVVPGPTGLPGNPGDGSQNFFYNNITEPAYSPEMGGVHKDGADEFTTGIPFSGRQFAGAGTTGLGDLDLSPDDRYLYAVNLNDKNIYRFDTWSSNPQSTMTVLPSWVSALNPCAAVGGPGLVHPFGLAVTNEDIFLGVVCTAEVSQNRADLRASVARYDRNTATWSFAFSFTLDAFDTQRAPTAAVDTLWYPWRHGITGSSSGVWQTYPQPLVSDIVFGEGGSMFIGMRDRFGDMTSSPPYTQGTRSEGELLRATPNGAGGWNAPPSAGAEFFNDQSGGGTGQEPEAGGGALAYVPGAHSGAVGGEIISTYLDPYTGQSFGAAWWDVGTGGTPTAREEIYSGGIGSHQFGKAAGLGDLELLCAWRAIGDRIWRDTNGNGVQDAGENDINGVRVQLFAASDTTFSTPLATVTTGNDPGMTGNYRFYIPPFQAYMVRIDPAMFGVGQPLFGLGYTLRDAGGNDASDSDADANGVITIPAGYNNEVNLTYDAGLSVGANVRITKSAPATVVVGSPLIYTLNWANDGPSVAANVVVQDTLPAGVTFVSASPAPSSISGSTLTWNLGTLAALSSGSITVNTTVDVNAPNSLVNTATITTTTPGNDPGDDGSTVTTPVLRPDVYVQKSGPATATVGDTFSYTLTYGNQGTAAANNVIVQDTLPVGLVFLSASPPTTSITGRVLTWNLGTLSPGQSGSITVQVASDATLPNGTVVVNQVQITTTTPGDDPGNNSGGSTTTLQRADVRLVKSSPMTFPVLSGQSVTYYLDFSNAGPAAATNVVLTDQVPAQLTNVTWSCTSGCAASGTGNSISINLGTLAAGASGRVTVTGTATTSLAREDFTNTGIISTDTPETDTTNNRSTVPGAVWTTDLEIIKLAQAQVAAGNTFTATLTYINRGPASATAAQIVDTLPAGVTFVSSTPAPTSQSGSTLSWNLGTLANGQSGTILLLLRSDASLANGTLLTNQARISTTAPDRNGANDQSSASTVVITRADLSVVKSAPARVSAGDTIAYTLSYTNAGPSVARSVVLTDTLPAELTYLSASPAPASVTGQTLVWSLGDLAPGASGTISIQTSSSFTQDVPTLTVTNTVVIRSTTPDPTPTNNTSTATTLIETADVSVVKTAPPFITAGAPFTATLDYANAGPAVARGVTLRDLLPSGLTVVSSTPPMTGPGQRWSLGDLAPGASGQVVLVLRAPTSAISGTTYTNVAIVDTPVTRDRDPSNDTDDAVSVVRPNADLSIIKTGPAGPLRSGSTVTYVLTWRNTGPSQAQQAQVSDTLPPGFSLTSATPPPTSQSGQTLTWALGNVDASMSGQITIVGTLAGSGTTTTRTNLAEIVSGTPDPDPTNNTDTVDTVVQQPDLQVLKTDGLSQVQPGDTITYTLTVSNVGPVAATGVVLTETPPAGATVLGSAWTAAAGGTYTLNIGTVGPGATVIRTFTIRLPNPPPAGMTSIPNVVLVADDGSAGPDPTPGDNTGSDVDTPIVGRVGDRVWFDKNNDGVQDDGEPGLPGVVVQLLDPDTLQVIATTTTDANGMYSFDGLRLGDYAVQLAPGTTQSGPYRGYQLTTDPLPVTTLDPANPVDLTLDFGLYAIGTTDVVLAYLRAERNGDTVVVTWQTLDEVGTARFRVLRSIGMADLARAVEVSSLSSQGSAGGTYQVIDTNVPMDRLFYWLVEVQQDGTEHTYGAFQPQATASSHFVFLPTVMR